MSNALEIYILNVGQADTAVIRTPNNKLIVIDAVKPRKVKALLQALQPDRPKIKHLILTHPHWDHYAGVSSLLSTFPVERVTLAPFWYLPGTSGYHQIINRIQEAEIPLNFLSGYDRFYPDGGTYPAYENQPYVELLGPPNNTLADLYESQLLTPNHLCIITRVTYGAFSIVLAADAQMENWAHYDREGMLAQRCDVLKAAHHGSRNGIQWERLERLSPSLVVVSSDPEMGHHLPDVIGSVIFLEYDRETGKRVALTRDTGTIKLAVSSPSSGRYTAMAFGEGADDEVLVGAEVPLATSDWAGITSGKL
ncbi:MAG: MBL fold metallo-hydrolase [Anaerolineales bacterium]|nr:MAG: MBL fold metallo-hydrolase [Anaerolineales bacterium]